MKPDYICILIYVIVLTITFTIGINAEIGIPNAPFDPMPIVGSETKSLEPDEYVDPKAIENIKDYLKDGDIYMFDVFEHSNRIRIVKRDTIHSKNKVFYFSKKSSAYSDTLYEIMAKPNENLKKYPVIENIKISDDIDYIIYSVEDKKLYTVIADKQYYINLSNIPIVDVKRISDNAYMVLHEGSTQVEFVHIDKSKIITEVYYLPFRLKADSFQIKQPTSVSILTDNIVRFEYGDGAIEHWKVRFTKDDVEKNMAMDKPREYNFRKLVWWNNIGKGSPFVNHEDEKSWDYNYDYSAEPIYDYKFP